MSDYIIQQENFDISLKMLDRLEKEFPESSVLGNGLLVKGDIYKTVQDVPAAEDAYLRAKVAAEASGNADVAGEALSRLVETAVSQEKWEEAAKYYDEFFGNEAYAKSTYKVQVAVMGLDALRNQERVDDGLDRLEEMIVDLSKGEGAGSDDMERAVNSYTTISAEERGRDVTIDRLTNFPGIEDATKSLKAWLLISKIGLLQEQAKGLPEDDPKKAKKAAEVQVAFNELKNFEKADLGNYILVQLGRYIVNTGNRFEAVPFFEEIMGRENKEFEDYALFELAKVWARDKDTRKKAKDAFKRIIEVFGTKELLEDSSIELGDLAVADEDWTGGLDIFQKYQKNKTFKRQRPKANFMIARCYEGQGDLTRAQKAYVGVFAVYTGHLEWSAQAHLRNANIEWNKGTEISKHNAYEMLRDLERMLGMHDGKEADVGGWVNKAIRRLNELRDELGITPEMERLEEEAKARGEVPGA
jgi:tetratricopeptide (TPR) repeat protein